MLKKKIVEMFWFLLIRIKEIPSLENSIQGRRYRFY